MRIIGATIFRVKARASLSNLARRRSFSILGSAIQLNKVLRHAFERYEYLPDDILWREKAAFSDAVGHSMVDCLKEYAGTRYTNAEFETRRKQYKHAQPFTKESLLYREIFEKYYPGQSEMIVDFWMPNRNWEGCDVNDPSARVLPNCGESGKYGGNA